MNAHESPTEPISRAQPRDRSPSLRQGFESGTRSTVMVERAVAVLACARILLGLPQHQSVPGDAKEGAMRSSSTPHAPFAVSFSLHCPAPGGKSGIPTVPRGCPARMIPHVEAHHLFGSGRGRQDDTDCATLGVFEEELDEFFHPRDV